MKKIFLLVAASLLTGGAMGADPSGTMDSQPATGSPSAANPTVQQSPTPAVGNPEPTAMQTGRVESVDRKGDWIRIRDAKGRVSEYPFAPHVEIRRGEEDGRLSDLKSGDPVSFRLDSSNEIVALQSSPLRY